MAPLLCLLPILPKFLLISLSVPHSKNRQKHKTFLTRDRPVNFRKVALRVKWIAAPFRDNLQVFAANY